MESMVTLGFMEHVTYLGFKAADFAEGAHQAFLFVHAEHASAQNAVDASADDVATASTSTLAGLLRPDALSALDAQQSDAGFYSPELFVIDQLRIVEAIIREGEGEQYTISIPVQYVLKSVSSASADVDGEDAPEDAQPRWLSEWVFERVVQKPSTGIDLEDDTRAGRVEAAAAADEDEAEWTVTAIKPPALVAV